MSTTFDTRTRVHVAPEGSVRREFPPHLRPRGQSSLGLRLLGLALGLRVICGLAQLLFFIPYYSAENSSDVAVYDQTARYVSDQARAGHFNEAPIGLGSDAIVLWFSAVYSIAGPHLWVVVAIHTGLSLWAGIILVRLAITLGEGPGSNLIKYLLLAPNITMWTVLPGKDSWVYLGLAVIVAGVVQTTRGRRSARSVAQLLLGLSIVLLFRPHVAVLMLISLGAAFLLASGTRKGGRWGKAVLTLVLCAAAVFMWPVVQKQAKMKQGGIDAIGERLTLNSRANSGGGSAVDVQGIDSVGDLVRAAPAGILRVVAQPFPWEVTSLSGAGASLDCVLLAMLIISRLAQIGSNTRALFSNSSIFFAIMGTATVMVLLITIPNLGLMLREKIQLVPLFVIYATRWRHNLAPSPVRRVQAGRVQPALGRLR